VRVRVLFRFCTGGQQVVAVALHAGSIVDGEVAGDFLALEVIVRANRRKEVTLLRVDQLLRLNQRRLRGRNRRIGPERPLHQRVERR
jgi:hypothetical protein